MALPTEARSEPTGSERHSGVITRPVHRTSGPVYEKMKKEQEEEQTTKGGPKYCTVTQLRPNVAVLHVIFLI